MKVAKIKQPQPVPGHVIGVSVLAILGMTVVMAVLFLLGVGLAVNWFVTEGKTVWALIGGLLLVVFCPLAVAVGVYRIRVKERLVLGEDRFQIIHRIQDRDEVITQIPYANMAEIKFEQGSQSNYLGILIARLNDPNTYQKKNDFETTKNVRQYHCVLDGGYTEPLETIYHMLAERFQQYHPQAVE